MVVKPRSTLRLVLTAIFLLFNGLPAQAGEPTEAIRAAINQGIQILKGRDLSDKDQRDKIIDRLRGIVYPLFDFEEMAKRSLGRYWRDLTPEQQREFVTVFKELLEKTYADKIDLYKGQKVVFTKETIDDGYAQVDTRVIGLNDQSYSVAYRLHRINGKWTIYDVVAENISVVNNYRSQFDRVLARSSFKELLKIMKEKAA